MTDANLTDSGSADRDEGLVRCDACPVLCRIRPGRAVPAMPVRSCKSRRAAHPTAFELCPPASLNVGPESSAVSQIRLDAALETSSRRPAIVTFR